MDSKKPWESKTIVLNAVIGLLAAVAMFWPGAVGVQSWITSNASVIAVGWSLLNVALRLVTKDKVSLSD